MENQMTAGMTPGTTTEEVEAILTEVAAATLENLAGLKWRYNAAAANCTATKKPIAITSQKLSS
jgi:hypothetical protein